MHLHFNHGKRRRRAGFLTIVVIAVNVAVLIGLLTTPTAYANDNDDDNAASGIKFKSKFKSNHSNLCTDDIKNLRLLKPSECDPTDDYGRVIPDITVGTTVYDNDVPHFVIGSPYYSRINNNNEEDEDDTDDDDNNINNIIVYLHGTTSSPGQASCLLKSVAEAEAINANKVKNKNKNGGVGSATAAATAAVIGLTYGFLNKPDAFRNERCGSLPEIAEKVECLSEQHNDAICGGTYGANHNQNQTEQQQQQLQQFWAPVDVRDSISGRLGLLLAKLDTEYPNEGWDAYYEIPNACNCDDCTCSADDDESRSSTATTSSDHPDDDDDDDDDDELSMIILPIPKWEHFVFSGHSQGAGHAAFLAQTKKIAGAALLSGPQDECIGCPDGTPFWIDDEFATTKITAFAHGDARSNYEPSIPIMKDNWKRMMINNNNNNNNSNKNNNNNSDRSSSSSSSSAVVHWNWKSPLTVHVIGSVGGGGSNNNAKYDACKTPIVSYIAPNAGSACGRVGHCSIALDNSSPVIPVTNNDNDNNNIYVYDSMGVWPSLFEVARC